MRIYRRFVAGISALAFITLTQLSVSCADENPINPDSDWVVSTIGTNTTSVVLELSEHRDLYSLEPGEFQEVIPPKDYSIYTSEDGREVLHVKDQVTGRYKQVVTRDMFPNQLALPPQHVDTDADTDTDYDDVRDTLIKTLLSLELPSPDIVVEPDPSVNKWNKIPVKIGLWFHTTTIQPAHTDTTTPLGTALSLDAEPLTVIDPGDGSTRFECHEMPSRPTGIDPFTPSPDCGHVYYSPGQFTITATTLWTITWNAGPYKGSILTATQGTRSIPINELHSVLVKPIRQPSKEPLNKNNCTEKQGTILNQEC